MKGIHKNAPTPKKQMVTLDIVGFMMNRKDIKVKKKKQGPHKHY